MLMQNIQFSSFSFELKGSDPYHVVRSLSHVIVKDTGLRSMAVQSKLTHLMKSSMIGIGDGLSVFDWLTPDIEEPYLLCARLESQVKMPAVDDRAVDIALVLISPEKNGPLHLQYLSRMTRIFRDEDLVRQLRSVHSVDGMKAVLHPESRALLAA